MILGLSPVLGNSGSWPILLALSVIPSLVSILVMYFMPESPRYLILTLGKVDEGREALSQLRGSEESSAQVEAEVKEILAEKRQAEDETSPKQDRDGGVDEVDENNSKTLTVLDLLKDQRLRLALMVCIVMHLSQQLSGINAIFYYSTSFFRDGGISCSVSQYATLCVGAIMVIMTFITIPLMEKLGRRVLHLAGLAGIILCSVTITIAGSAQEAAKQKPEGNATGPANNSEDACGAEGGEDEGASELGIFLIISTLAFVVFFAIGPGSIPWMCVGELLNQRSRGAATSVAVLVNWLANLVVGLVFPTLQDNISSLSFIPFLVITALNFAFLIYFLPETKNRTTNEISQLLAGRGAWKKAIGFK